MILYLTMISSVNARILMVIYIYTHMCMYINILRPPSCFLPAGYNQWGELGLEDKEDRGDGPNEMGDNLPFVDLGDNVDVQAISLGDWHT